MHRVVKPTVTAPPTLVMDRETDWPTVKVFWNATDFESGANGADPVFQVRVFLSVTKEAYPSRVAGTLSRQTTVNVRDGIANFTDLNFETSYYACLYAISQGNISSNAGAWSDPVRFPCPSGGDCVGDGGTSEEYGVPHCEVRAQPGFFPVDWATTINTTFARCPVEKNCLGGKVSNASCRVGTKGAMCDLCLKGYSKAGSSLCRPCSEESVQILYAILGSLAGLAGLGAIIFLTLQGKGRASSLGVGIGKSGLRYFQLASLAASFPLEWPRELSALFGIMNIASSAAGDVLSVECSVGTDFVANAR